MAEDTKAIARMVALLAAGLLPSIITLVVAPSRAVAIATSGHAAMAMGFLLWTQTLWLERGKSRKVETTLRESLARLDEQVQDLSRELHDAKSHDQATGVLNRAAFLRRLEECIARDARLEREMVLLVVDVEGFKALNVEKGRDGGDAILKCVAHALADATRGSDAVGRLGGDEFGVVLGECDDPGPAVKRIFANVEVRAEGSAKVHVSVGAVTIADPAAGVDLGELFKLADAALTSVRGTGKNLCARRALGARTSEPVSA